MLYGNYRFQCRFETDAELPAYKGSTFRGVFGHALKRVVCALKRQECPDCILRERCLYTRVFETALSQGGQDAVRNSAIPHPFVIEPPPETKTHYVKSDVFECGLILFGEMNQNLPYFIYAFDLMGEIGIGRKVSGERARFCLERVLYDQKAVYERETGILKAPEKLEALSLEPAFVTNGSGSRLKVTLCTPLRIKSENKLSAELPFHLIVRAALRRVSSLFNCYGEGEPNLDYSGLVRNAEGIRTLSSDLHWFDWRRYSNRQNQDMEMGGMVGSVTYEGDLAGYLPLIHLAQKTHIGKQTAFGLGKFVAASVV